MYIEFLHSFDIMYIYNFMKRIKYIVFILQYNIINDGHTIQDVLYI